MTDVIIGDGDNVIIKTSAETNVTIPLSVEIWQGLTDGIPLATEFRLPLKDLTKPWYEATRRFGPYNYHPYHCEDWNTESGGNSDLGEPLVAPWSGVVLSAKNWYGDIGRVLQILGLTSTGELIVWAGWHLQEIYVLPGEVVTMGQDAATLGNADGVYYAHLHEQICTTESRGVPTPNTFGSSASYTFHQPSQFYIDHGVDADLVRQCTEFDGEPEFAVFATQDATWHPFLVE